jgi:hypothetical protein
MSESKLESLRNVSCQGMVKCLSQIQECIARQVDNFGGIILKKKTCIKCRFTADIPFFFLFIISNPILQSIYLKIFTIYCRILYIRTVETCALLGFYATCISLIKERRMSEFTHPLVLFSDTLLD